MGAIASGGVRVLDQTTLRVLRIPSSVIDRVAATEQRELERREALYRSAEPAPDVRDRVVILVDDGLATGSSIRAAVAAPRPQAPRKIVVAVPVAAAEICAQFRHEVDEVVCAETPEPFLAVGRFYDDFAQTTDAEVRDLLERARRRERVAGGRVS